MSQINFYSTFEAPNPVNLYSTYEGPNPVNLYSTYEGPNPINLYSTYEGPNPINLHSTFEAPNPAYQAGSCTTIQIPIMQNIPSQFDLHSTFIVRPQVPVQAAPQNTFLKYERDLNAAEARARDASKIRYV